MPIDFTCGTCGKTLRVPDESAGKKARCSNCQTVVAVPGGAPTAAPMPAAGSTFPPVKSPGDNVGATATPNPFAVPNVGPQYGSNMPHVSAGAIRADAVAPLKDAAFWMQLIGWVNIVVGVLCCLTIVGIVVAWVFIWQGICLKNSGDSLKAGLSDGNVHNACRNLKTYFTIIGVLMIIELVFTVLCFLFIIFFFVLGGAAAGGGF